jgi:hypothetical protein
MVARCGLRDLLAEGLPAHHFNGRTFDTIAGRSLDKPHEVHRLRRSLHRGARNRRRPLCAVLGTSKENQSRREYDCQPHGQLLPIGLCVTSRRMKSGRGDWIRTSDPPLPKRMRYQTALRPDSRTILCDALNLQMGDCRFQIGLQINQSAICVLKSAIFRERYLVP